MAFNLQHFQFNRGVTSANTQGQGFTPVIHAYKSETDTRATISGANYFPPFIDGDTEKVFVGDALLIVASDGTSLVMFTDLSPVVLGPDLLVSGPTLTVGAPIAPLDGNALRISGNVIQAEIATSTHPGIVSIVGQGFFGTKNFLSGINVFDPGITATHINSTGIGPLPIGDDGSTSQVHVVPPLLVDAGVSFITDVPTTTLTAFHDEAVPVSWSGCFTVAQPGALLIQKFNNIVYLTIREISLAAQSNVAGITSGAVIPVGLRPTAALVGLVRIIDNGTAIVGSFQVTAAGVVNIFNSLDATAFSGVGSAAVEQPTIAYTIV